jgi:probable F420-dependent oxidoreductase
MDVAIQLAGMPAGRLIKGARRAEEQGFAAVYVPDHFADEPPGSSKLSDTTPMPEALSALGAIAAATSRVRVGGHVLCNLFRHPALTAQATATIDQVSEGRAVLGIGAGWTKNEFDMTGIAYPEIGPRLRMLDEALQIITSLWSEPRTTFRGEFYQLADAFITVKPVQKPRPPILLGGSGKGLLRIAAKHADVVNVILDIGRAGTVVLTELAKLTEDAFKAKLDFVRSEARRHDRELALSSTIFVLMITETEAEAEQAAAGLAGGFGLPAASARRMPMTLIGTPAQCTEELKRREREWGIRHLVLSSAGGPAMLERFAREVLPHL